LGLGIGLSLPLRARPGKLDLALADALAPSIEPVRTCVLAWRRLISIAETRKPLTIAPGLVENPALLLIGHDVIHFLNLYITTPRQ
jgi:hypothetical protein